MSPVQKGCTLKVHHKDFEAAQASANEMRERRVYVNGEGAPSPYFCSRCGHWHVGSSAPRKPDFDRQQGIGRRRAGTL